MTCGGSKCPCFMTNNITEIRLPMISGYGGTLHSCSQGGDGGPLHRRSREEPEGVIRVRLRAVHRRIQQRSGTSPGG